MLKFDFCLPILGKAVPSGKEWFHEVKYDPYRIRLERDGDRVLDVLAIDGKDLREPPLSMRMTNLARLLRGRPDGTLINPFESGAIGPDLFRAAFDMGLEGLVSKHADKPYRGGWPPHWIKVKNRQHHANDRVAIAKGRHG